MSSDRFTAALQAADLTDDEIVEIILLLCDALQHGDLLGGAVTDELTNKVLRLGADILAQRRKQAA